MCKVSINIDEAALRELRPELNTTEAIGLWAQQFVNSYIQKFKREKALQHDMSPEQLYDLVAEEIDAIYANGWPEVKSLTLLLLH